MGAREPIDCVIPAQDSIPYLPIWHHHLGSVEVTLHLQHHPSVDLYHLPTAWTIHTRAGILDNSTRPHPLGLEVAILHHHLNMLHPHLVHLVTFLAQSTQGKVQCSILVTVTKVPEWEGLSVSLPWCRGLMIRATVTD